MGRIVVELKKFVGGIFDVECATTASNIGQRGRVNQGGISDALKNRGQGVGGKRV